MATLSKKLDLEVGIWQLVDAAGGFVGQKQETVVMEICNADALPSGDIPQSLKITIGDSLQFPAPLSGYLYVRTTDKNGTLIYYATL